MNPDPERLFQYLDQTRLLYGNHLFLENTEQDEIETLYGNLNSFKESICTCQKCPLSLTRKNFVFGDNPNRWLYTAITITISINLFKYSIQSAYGKQRITINLSAIIQKTFKPPDSGRFIVIKT